MMNTLNFKDTAQRIVKYIKTENLKDITLRKLINDSPFTIDDSFYSGLDWLAREDKIVFLITPVETYVLPVNII